MTNREWFNSLQIEQRDGAVKLICKDCPCNCDPTRFVAFLADENGIAYAILCKPYVEKWLNKEHEA